MDIDHIFTAYKRSLWVIAMKPVVSFIRQALKQAGGH
jgi:hypothetical protein